MPKKSRFAVIWRRQPPGELFEKSDERIPDRRWLSGQKFQHSCDFLTCPGTEGAQGRPGHNQFLQQRLNQSEGQTMQATNRKIEKKSQNRKTNGIFEATSLREQIEARAHEIYILRGAEADHELDDWLQAEREIMGWV